MQARAPINLASTLTVCFVIHTPPEVVLAAIDGWFAEFSDAGVASVNSQLSELINTCSHTAYNNL